jgi:predicted NBD/HSP70 family sugar kinase
MISNASLQTPRDLRRVNQQHLLRLIYFHEPISRLDLSDLSGLSPATVTNLVGNMLEQGVVIPAGFEESQGGRPRETLVINPDYGRFIGVEVAETRIYTELFDLKLQPLGAVCLEISPDENRPDTIVDYIVESIMRVKADVLNENIFGAGIGLPGIVDPVGGVSVFAPNWGWRNVPLLAALRDRLDINFLLDNGKQALALAEARFGAGAGCNDLAVLLIGTGIGAGIFSNGKLMRGVTNSAGEWGHTCIDANGPPCRCGSRGCVETFVGGPGIIRHLTEVAPDSDFLQQPSQEAIVRALRDAGLEGDPVAVRVLDDVTHYLGLGIANLINMVNPQRVVIGGWCGELLNPYVLPRLNDAVKPYALDVPYQKTEFHPVRLEGVGISVGAASLVLETFLSGEPVPVTYGLIGEWETN